jgi:hypothetical protein
VPSLFQKYSFEKVSEQAGIELEAFYTNGTVLEQTKITEVEENFLAKVMKKYVNNRPFQIDKKRV